MTAFKTKVSKLERELQFGVAFGRTLGGRTSLTDKGDEYTGDKGSNLIHLTATRPKPPKRRPPSGHFSSVIIDTQVNVCIPIFETGIRCKLINA